MTELITEYSPTDLDIAPPFAVGRAASDFAEALVDTAEYRAFEVASAALHKDDEAQKAIDAYRRKVESLRVMSMLNAVDAEQQAELDRLRAAFATRPSVVAYNQAEQALVAMCQLTADLLSQHIGLNFAAACRSGCCS